MLQLLLAFYFLLAKDLELGTLGTFNFMIVFQEKHNILRHPFHMLGKCGVFDDSMVTSSFIKL